MYCNAVAISDEERAVFRHALHAKALTFYEVLRLELAQEFTQGRLFSLPAKLMAKRELLPGHRNEKLYLRLTSELVRLGLIVKVLPAGFRRDKSRRPASYVFSGPRVLTGRVIPLTFARAP